MRNKRLIFNVISNLVLQIVLAISGLIIPKLIITYSGSTLNGMLSSVTQFLTYAALVEVGVGDAAVAALYKPLAENKVKEINQIVSSAKRIYGISGIIYALLCVVLAFIYPLFIQNQLDYSYVFFMVIILGCNGVVDYFFLGKYKILLIAEQKSYIINLFRSVSTLIMLVASCGILIWGQSILIVKVVCVIIHCMEIFCIYIYVKIYYKEITYISKVKVKIAQQWNALIHKVCVTIVYNTDLVVLTIFLPGNSLLIISVYTVYAMVASMMNNMVGLLTNGVNATFGNMFAKGENSSLKKSYDIYEYVYFIFLFVIYTSMLVLIDSFIACYTRDVTDMHYVQSTIGVLFVINCFTANLKDPSGTIINAAGKFRETQKYAITEAVINIVISLILVKKFGVMGVLVGTTISHIYMLIVYVKYTALNIMGDTLGRTLKRGIRNLFIGCFLFLIERQYSFSEKDFSIWILQAIIISIANLFFFILINAVLERNSFRDARSRIKKVIKNN